jgi:hypothetical protein
MSAASLQVDVDILAGGDPFLEIAMPGAERVDPGFADIFEASHIAAGEAGLPAVVAQGL